MLKILVFSLALVTLGYYLGATHPLDGKFKKADYAQCELESTGKRGANFEKIFTGGKTNPSISEQDAAYRNFMEWCMQSKGHDFQRMYNGDGSINTMCWNYNGGHSLPEAHVSEVACFN